MYIRGSETFTLSYQLKYEKHPFQFNILTLFKKPPNLLKLFMKPNNIKITFSNK